MVYECVKTADLSKGYQNPKRKLGCRYYIFDNWRKTQTTVTEVERNRMASPFHSEERQ